LLKIQSPPPRSFSCLRFNFWHFYRYSGLTKSANVFGSSYLWWPSASALVPSHQYYPFSHCSSIDVGAGISTYRARDAHADRLADPRIPFSAHCHIQDSAQRGGRGTSGIRKGHWLAYGSLRYGKYVDGRGDCVDANSGWGRWLGAYSKPDSNMRISRVACAAGVLFVAEGLYHNGVVEGSWLRGFCQYCSSNTMCRDCFSIALIPKSFLPNQTFKP